MSMTPEEARAAICQCCYHLIVGDPIKCKECSYLFCADCATSDDLCPECGDGETL